MPASRTALLLLCLLAAPARIGAETPTERALGLYRQGSALYSRGEYVEAIRAFEASLAVRTHPNTLYAIGEAYRRLGKLRRSYDYYWRYASQLEGDERDRFLIKLGRMRDDAISPLTVTTEPPGASVWVDGVRRGATSLASPLRLPLRAGAHLLRVALAGHADIAQTVVAEYGEPLSLSLRLVRPASEEMSRPAVDPAAPAESGARGGWLLGLSLGPAIASYGDPALSASASLTGNLEGGYLRWFGGIGLTLVASVQLTSVVDTVVQDRAAFINCLGVLGARVPLPHRFWLELRFGLGAAILLDAAPESFLIRRQGGGAESLASIALQPALRVGWRFWRGLGLFVSPFALDYSPRVGGFGELSPSISAILRYHAAVGLTWQLSGLRQER